MHVQERPFLIYFLYEKSFGDNLQLTMTIYVLVDAREWHLSFFVIFNAIDQNVLPTEKTEIALEMELATKVWTHYGYWIAKKKSFSFFNIFSSKLPNIRCQLFFYQ